MGESIGMSQAQGQGVQEPSAGCELSSAKAREVLVGPCPCPYLSVGMVTKKGQHGLTELGSRSLSYLAVFG